MIGIIGANSFIGRNLALALAQTDAVFFARDFDGFNFDHSKHSCVTMDFSKPDTFSVYIEQCSTIVLLINSRILGADTYENFLKYIERKHAQIKHIIFASSGGAIYGEGFSAPIPENAFTKPKSTYGQTKLDIENLILDYSQNAPWNATIMRIANPIGLHVKKLGFVSAALQAAKNDEALQLWARKDYVRDYFSVKDLCGAIDLIIKTPSSRNKIYNIGSGVGHSIDQMLEIISKVSNKKIRINQRNVINDDVEYNVLDCSAIRNDLNWDCKIGIEDIIQELWQEMRVNT